jgi:predicted metal-dependent hydrolase
VDHAEQFRAGIQLFNEGHYWHAHEAWEDVWKAEDDAQSRLFYKGIIQTAAALVHWQRGNPRGLTLNWRKARAKLQQLPPRFNDLDLENLIKAMDMFETGRGEELQPPQLVLGAPH